MSSSGSAINYARWRKHAIAAGLLVPSPKDTCDLPNNGGSSSKRTPCGDCGVSIAWLEAFANVLAREGAEAQELSTAGVVAKLISVSCTLRVTHTTPPAAGDGPGRNSYDGRSSAQRTASLSQTQQQQSQQQQSGAVAPSAERRELHVRLFDLIPPQNTGRPDYYIIHAWQGNCLSCLKAVVGRLMAQGGDKAGQEYAERTYVWLDWVALIQQAWLLPQGCTSPCSPFSTGPNLQMWGPPPNHVDIVAMREVQAKCSGGSLLVLDRDMAVLNRIWPLYEAWAATYFAPVGGNGAQSLLLILTPNIRPSSLLALRSACEHLDITRAECSRIEDKQRIIGEVKSSAGLKRMQQALGENLLTGIRSYLRWCGGLDELALFAVLLLQGGDYAQLQYLLHSLPGLADDENTLNEIRAIFAMYDSDGTGELEEDEFVAVLALAGFGEEESHDIFDKVDVDGGGSVGLDEFEAWWIETQRQQARDMRPTIQLTLGGLLTNLRAFSVMLQRKECPVAADLINQHADALEASGINGAKCSETPLPAFNVYGDYLTVADQVVFKIMSGDLKTALRLVLDLLHLNSDALALEGPPDQLLPTMVDMADASLSVQRCALAWGMALVAELLGRNPGRLREAEHFAHEALDLAAKGAPSEGAPATLYKSKKTKRKPSQQHKARDAIVTSMVRLKYGKDSFISHKLIAEASISLSTWMASSKGHAKMVKDGDTTGRRQVTVASATADVNDFASTYLNAGQRPSDTQGGNTAKENKLPLPLAQMTRNLHCTFEAALAASRAAYDAPAADSADGHTDGYNELLDSLEDADGIPLPSLGVPCPHPDAPPPILVGPTPALPPKPAAGGRASQLQARAQDKGSRRQSRTISGSGYLQSQVQETDDAGVEHLTQFAKAMRVRGADTPDPLDQLGSRLQRVAGRQQHQRAATTSPSPILTMEGLPKRLSSKQAREAHDGEEGALPAMISLCSMRRPSRVLQKGASIRMQPSLLLATKQSNTAPTQPSSDGEHEDEVGERAPAPKPSEAPKTRHADFTWPAVQRSAESATVGGKPRGPTSAFAGGYFPPAMQASGDRPSRSSHQFNRTSATRSVPQGAVSPSPAGKVLLASAPAGLNFAGDPRAAKLAGLGLLHLPPIGSGAQK